MINVRVLNNYVNAAIVCLLFTALGNSTAYADVEFSGKPIVIQQVSGIDQPQNIKRVGWLDDSRGYIKSVYTAETSGDPCWLSVTESPLTGGRALLGGSTVGVGCKNFVVSSGRDVKAPSGQYITALRICVAKQQKYLSGIEITLGELQENNTLATTGQDAFNRPACHSWSKWSSCPKGAVLIAVNAHLRTGSRRDSIVGLQSICKRVRNS